MNKLNPATQLSPPRIADASGVALSIHHLEFVGLTAQAIGDWRARRAPLGMTPGQYRAFCEELFTAATQDNIPDLDLRIKGSAAGIFSCLHKTLPVNRVDLAVAYLGAFKAQPQTTEQDQMDAQREKLWALQPYPRQRPFDSMFKLGADPLPSDYDIQLSSNEIANRCTVEYSSRPRYSSYPEKFPLVHPEYGYLLSPLVTLIIPSIKDWADRWTKILYRDVNVKAFSASGPPNVTLKVGELSSHHRASDWMIDRPIPGVD